MQNHSINLQYAKSVTDLRYIFCESYRLISVMVTALAQSQTVSFDENTFIVINDSKKKRKRSDIDNMHKEIIKTIDFKDTFKDDLQDRINILLVNENLINKFNRNLNSYC